MLEMEAVNLCQQRFLGSPPLRSIVATGIATSEPNTRPQALGFIGSDVPSLREPLEFNPIGGDRQQRAQGVFDIGCVQRSQCLEAFRPPPSARRRKRIQHAAAGPSSTSVRIAQYKG